MLPPANFTASRRKPFTGRTQIRSLSGSGFKLREPSCRLSFLEISPSPNGLSIGPNDDDQKHQDRHEPMEQLGEQVAQNHRSLLNTQPDNCPNRQNHRALHLRPANSSSLFICSESANAPSSRRETGAIGRLGTLKRLPIFRSRSESHLSRSACELEPTELVTEGRSVDCVDRANVKHSLPELSIRSCSEDESGCCCGCHQQLDSSTFDTNSRLTLATFNDATDDEEENGDSNAEDEEEEEDFSLLYETRSALDYVEESPSNHDLSIRSDLSFSEIDNCREEEAFETQLYCSLTNDSTISRQNSPLHFSVERESQAYSTEISERVESCSPSSRGLEGPRGASERAQLDKTVSAGATNLNEGHAAAGSINQLESSIWSVWQQMELDENNACADIHGNEATTCEDCPQLNDGLSPAFEARQGELGEAEGAASRPTFKRPHEDDHFCAHEREATRKVTDGGGNLVRLKLDNDGNLQTDNKASNSPGAPMRIDDERDALSHSDANELASQTENFPSASMRAAKDLAKLSLPSLSSLQYIPGQLDSKPTRSIDRTIRKMPNSSRGESYAATTAAAAGAASVSSNVREVANLPGGLMGENESPASQAPKDDRSCLLHRLCLCNCMALDKSDPCEDLESAKQESSPKLSSRKQRQATTSSKGPESPSNSAESQEARIPYETTRLRLSPTNVQSKSVNFGKFADRNEDVSGRDCGSDEMEPKRVTEGLSVTARDSFGAKRCKKTEIAQETATRGGQEKQSLSFLRLLKSSSPAQYERIDGPRASPRKSLTTEIVGDKSRGLSVHNSGTRSHLGRGLLSVGSDGLNSIEDLPTSGRSSSASGTKSTTRSDESFSGRRSADILSEVNAPIRPESSTGLTNESPGVCHHCKHQATASDHKHRLRSFRKLLKPNKLFTSSSSVCEHTDLEAAQPQDCDTRSFFSRSLSRLSKRKSTKAINHTSNIKSRSGCTSPDNSFSNASHIDASEDSVNSLEELNLAQSLPFEINRKLLIYKPDVQQSTRVLNAPEIILSKVEYQSLSTRTQKPDSMTSSEVPSPDQSQCQASAQNATPDLDSTDRATSRASLVSDISLSDSLPHSSLSLPGSPSPGRQHRSHHRSPRLTNSPVPFQSPATESTKIEDGLKVCCVEHFEKHISHIKDDQIEAQKNLFTTWINFHVPNLIRGDLIEELRDGIKLIGLLAALTHDKSLTSRYKKLMSDEETYCDRLVLSPGGRMRTLSNIMFGIDFLRKKLGMKLVNLNAMDILSGKSNVVLGLCWNIILHFQMEKGLECHDLDKQRLFSMEQTLKNWISYEQSCHNIKNWLKTAEKKLTDSLQPEPICEQSDKAPNGTDVNDWLCLSDRLADLIEFFELESVDIDNIVGAECSPKLNSLSSEAPTGSFNNSLSSSMLSLGSNASRIPILTNSNKASYQVLFDDFELKCRLLATMVEPDKRPALLMTIKKFRARLKYITDIKVPHVLNELRMSIDRCAEQHIEVPNDLEGEAIGQDKSESSLGYIEHSDHELSTEVLQDELDSPPDFSSDFIEPKTDENLVNSEQIRKKQSKSKKSGPKEINLSIKTQINSPKTKPCIDDEDGTRVPFYKELWRKLCRATKMSLPFNIILLICLAGACIIPLIQNEACCELNQAAIASELPINQRPT